MHTDSYEHYGYYTTNKETAMELNINPVSDTIQNKPSQFKQTTKNNNRIADQIAAGTRTGQQVGQLNDGS
jgi:hypothetical protein